MATKPDVKAMMARFSSEGQATEGVAPGRPKVAVHPTLSSGSLVNQKKPYIETSLSGGTANTPPKPNFLKSTVPPKVAPDVREPAKTKAIASMFEKSQEDSKPSYVKQQNFKTKTEVSQDAEVKNLPHKPPFQKPPLSSPSSDIKPAAPKAATAAAKPSWVKDATPKPVDSKSSPNSLPAKLPPTLKPVSSFAKMRIKSEDNEVGTSDSTVKSFPPVTVPKPSNVRTAQNAFKKADAQSEDRAKEIDKIQVTSTDSCPPIKPPATKKPSFKKPMSSAYPAGLGNHSAPTGSSSGPKKAPLPNSLALGTAPAKPNRPPRVNLEKFKRGGEARAEDGPAVVRKGSGPPPPASHPSTHVAPPSVAPSLPPRPPGASVQPDLNDSYDDVGVNNRPPLPSGVHPSQRPEDSDDGSETYEDLDERWEAMESKEQEKKREKDEKKRQEAEKKEQKERERKEQEARKKFKLTGPLQTLHKVKARGDCKGNKMDLAYKQGDSIEIIRVIENPEGRWLGRTQEGSYGYVKTEGVETDFDTLKRQGASLSQAQDVYDDVDFTDKHNCDNRGPGVVLPPPPDEDEELYDDLDSSFNSGVRLPPPSQLDQEDNAGGEEIYDDVDVAQPVSSKTKGKVEDKDPKKQKKFEKEEKEFRKKFKHEGEIQVLYQVTIGSTVTNKKWSGKDLPIKAGETLDVIVTPKDGKVICRNEEGKFGYVLTSYIVVEDADIYDDIGDDCIYDND